MNTDERRAFTKFESEYMIRLDPEKWDMVKREFCEQRKDRYKKPSEEEITLYLEHRGISFEYADA
jgi:hypothetical protein